MDKKIIYYPKVLESFSRCECDYHLLDLQNGRYAIEWAEWTCRGGDTYAIVYEMEDEARNDFDKLRDRGISYTTIERRTEPENILSSPPWAGTNEWETSVRITKKFGDFWNSILLEQDDDDGWGHCGPYETLYEAINNLMDDYIRIKKEYPWK